jgi:hypothetical protein
MSAMIACTIRTVAMIERRISSSVPGFACTLRHAFKQRAVRHPPCNNLRYKMLTEVIV